MAVKGKTSAGKKKTGAAARPRARKSEASSAVKARTRKKSPKKTAAAAKPRASAKKASSGKAPATQQSKPLSRNRAIMLLVAVGLLVALVHWGQSRSGTSAADRKKPVVAPPASDLAGGPARPPKPSPPPAWTESAPVEPVAPEKPSVVASYIPEPTPEPKEAKPQPPPPAAARVAIVIDDFGQNMEHARDFLTVPLPLVYSILPHLPHSGDVAKLAKQNNHEVLLHMPMEPKSYPKDNPGEGALLLSMSQSEISDALDRALDSNPYAIGVNNHMGSRFTEDAKAMRLVLSELKRRKLFFLDSRTTADTAVPEAAREVGLPFLTRRVFLDHEQTEAFVQKQVDNLIRAAKASGAAIAVGHPYDCTLTVLKKNAKRFRREGVAVVPLSELLPPRG